MRSDDTELEIATWPPAERAAAQEVFADLEVSHQRRLQLIKACSRRSKRILDFGTFGMISINIAMIVMALVPKQQRALPMLALLVVYFATMITTFALRRRAWAPADKLDVYATPTREQVEALVERKRRELAGRTYIS